jgi:predicted DNA-binding protein (MmcQ/YjbR family)
MDFDAFNAMALALPGAAFDVKWGNDRTYCVGGKIFAMAGAVDDPRPPYGFKASDIAFELLIDQGLAAPMAYVGRYKWVQLKSHDALPPSELAAYVAQSHAQVAKGLTKTIRLSIGMAS